MRRRIVIVGGGQGGFELAASLRKRQYDGIVQVIETDAGLPYQRPPLSKTYLSGAATGDALNLRPKTFYDRAGIELIHGIATCVDREHHRVDLDDGRALSYDDLVLATGATARPLPVPGRRWRGVHSLRTREDADTLRNELPAAGAVLVVGAGMIGLEFAAASAKLGRPATIVEFLDRGMARVVSPTMSAHFAELHAQHGNLIRHGVAVTGIDADDRGHVTSVQLSDGTSPSADLVLVAVGIRPNVGLAAASGLPTDNGIVVDELLRTEDPAISAIGDCARFPSPYADQPIRLESVQNAVDQARSVAARLTGCPEPYTSFPWFWSDQFGSKLQIAGLTAEADDYVTKRHDTGFSVFCFRSDRLVGVESVNRPADHLAARRALAQGAAIGRADLESRWESLARARR